MNDIYTAKKHIFVVSNEPRSLAEIKMELTDSFDVSIAANGATVLAASEKYEIDAVVIHIGVSRENAFYVFNDIFKAVKNKGVPILFLAERDNVDDEKDAFSLGAADYAVRKRDGVSALVSRIALRILAGENERQVLSDEGGSPSLAAVPEALPDDKTILVVDDVALNRDLIEGMLFEIEGLSLDFAGNGEDAVQKYSQTPNRFSLILMDVQMPVMDGIDATRTIRGLPLENAREIPIIALTAGVEEDDVASYFDAGMNNFLEKPMDYNLLVNMVSKYVS